ncbi:hypothetical protein EB796_007077 [Bugula neritina]|uniref:Uncharacterized protein n=1 Tax=Bugula neritina TaxID=10212 RepID=A0A7J7K7K8_BUGNE|nr:hypothetical protein EB796_007077 [Bugula neritina]
MYGKAGFEHVTNSWNLLGKNAACCGINSGDDFQHAKYWSGEIAADSAPCGATATKGCKEDLESHFISYDDIWFTSVIAVKVFLMVSTFDLAYFEVTSGHLSLLELIMLLHTTCVCKSGLQHGISRDSESFRLVNKK